MTLILYKISIAFLLFILSMLAGYYPLKRADRFPYASAGTLSEAFASGIFLGAAFFHLLPDAIAVFSQVYPLNHYPVPEIICISGFLFLVFLERLSTDHTTNRMWIPYILALALIIHALTEGLTLGLNGIVSETLMLSLAILAHKSSASFALSTALIQQRTLSIHHIKGLILLFSLMTPMGIIIGTAITHFFIMFSAPGKNVLVPMIFNAFAAGTFLYIAILHGPYHHANTLRGDEESKNSMAAFLWLSLGLSTMALIQS